MRLVLAILILVLASRAEADPLGDAVKAFDPGAVRVLGPPRPREARQLERELAGSGDTRVTVTLKVDQKQVRAELVAVQARLDLLRPARWWRRQVVEWPLDARWSRILAAPVARKLGKPAPMHESTGTSFLAVAIADLDGDGRGELYAASADELLMLGTTRKRTALLGEPAVPRSRVPVATIVVVDADQDGKDELLVASSSRRVFTRIDENGALPGEPVWPLCQDRSGRLVPGTPLLAVVGQPAELLAFACSRLGSVAVAGDGHFWLESANGARSGEGAGSAVALFNLERDGRPELVSSSASPPDLGDALAVDGRVVWASAGQIIAVAVGDRTGDGLDDVVWLVHERGQQLVWTLE